MEPKYLDDRSILVSTPKGLKRLTVPFTVIVAAEVEGYIVGEKVTVALVASNKQERLLYQIKGAYYKYSVFKIMLSA